MELALVMLVVVLGVAGIMYAGLSSPGTKPVDAPATDDAAGE